MKKAQVWAVTLLLALVLAACSQQPTPTAEPESTDAAPAEESSDESVDEGGDAPAEAAAVPITEAELVGPVWQWVDFVQAGSSETTDVADPEKYEIVFNADGTANVQADCVMIDATYTLEDGDFSILLGPFSPMAYCGQDSLYQIFLGGLAEIDSAETIDGNLILSSDMATSTFEHVGTPEIDADGDPVSDTRVLDVMWQWADMVETAPASQSVVPNPENYVVVFRPDGTLEITADCNVVGGSYTAEGNSVSIQLGPSTMAFCGEESLDQLFLSTLGSVTSGEVEDDRLFLSTFDGSRMGFNDGGVSISIGMLPQDVSIDTQDLPYSWEANLVEATPYDESMPPGPMGMPDHMEINFGGDSAEAGTITPIMYIIPVDSYLAQWDAAGNDTVAIGMDGIYAYTNALPFPAPTAGLPVLPTEVVAGVNDIATQLNRLSVPNSGATLNGYRFVGRWEQSPNPVVNGTLNYVYQGFTNDAKYLVSFWYPVTSAELPNDVSEVPQDGMDLLNSDPNLYLQQASEQLNALSPDQFDPPLSTLDAVVASLTITTVPATGLTDVHWQLTGERGSDGSEESFSDAQNNWVVFGSDNTMAFNAECNLGRGQYDATGGMIGRLTTELGPMTRAACPGPYADMLIATLTSAQDFKIHPGGDVLELVRPAGGGSLLFSNEGPSDVITDAPEIEIPEPEGDVIGTVSAVTGVNVRTGPASSYDVIGVAPFGTQGEIIGRSADWTWWVVSVPSAENGQGWVSSAYVSVEGDTSTLPVIAPPAPPAPTPTPTPPPPSILFSANPTNINSGQCSTLTWDVENIQAVWVYPEGDTYTDYPVTGQGSEEVCPSQTTTYEMRVLRTDGVVELYSVTVNVKVTNPLPNTQWSLAVVNGNEAVLSGVTITLIFDGDDGISGFAGCNNYSGGYEVSGNSIIFRNIVSSQVACEYSELESTYLQNLQNAVQYQISNGQLIIRDGVGNELLRFNRLG